MGKRARNNIHVIAILMSKTIQYSHGPAVAEP